MKISNLNQKIKLRSTIAFLVSYKSKVSQVSEFFLGNGVIRFQGIIFALKNEITDRFCRLQK